MNEITAEIKTFKNPQFGEIRAVEKDGEPWFSGKDVAACVRLQLSAQRAVRDHVDDEDKGVNETFTPGGKQE